MAYRPPLPRLPGWVPWVAGLAWLMLLVAEAAMTAEGALWRVLAALMRTAGGVAFSVAGVAALVEVWSRREWKARTGYLALAWLDRVVDAGRVVADVCTAPLAPVIDRRWTIGAAPLSDWVAVPSDDSRVAVRRLARSQILEARNLLEATMTQARRAQDAAFAAWTADRRAATRLHTTESAPADPASSLRQPDECTLAAGEELGPAVVREVATRAASSTEQAAAAARQLFEVASDLCPYVDDESAELLLRASLEMLAVTDRRSARRTAASSHLARTGSEDAAAPASWIETVQRHDEASCAFDAAVRAADIVAPLDLLVEALQACYRDVARRPGIRERLTGRAFDPVHQVHLMAARLAYADRVLKDVKRNAEPSIRAHERPSA